LGPGRDPGHGGTGAPGVQSGHGGTSSGGSVMVTTTWMLVLALAVGLAIVIEVRGQ
jgi:hypothetical protein